MTNNWNDDIFEETQVALREGIERAKELVCEAKQMIRQHETRQATPPSPADLL